MAAITAGWLLVYYIAGGIGSAIGGGKFPLERTCDARKADLSFHP